jgi:hypothetical protein
VSFYAFSLSNMPKLYTGSVWTLAITRVPEVIRICIERRRDGSSIVDFSGLSFSEIEASTRLTRCIILPRLVVEHPRACNQCQRLIKDEVSAGRIPSAPSAASLPPPGGSDLACLPLHLVRAAAAFVSVAYFAWTSPSSLSKSSW